MDLNAAMIFVKVVRLGSFRNAARELGLPNSTVSDKVSDLEKALGVSLLVRTTRKLRLTEAGAAFFEKAEAAVASLLGAGEEASSFQKQPTGTLKISASADFDPEAVCEAIAEYREKYPEVKVELYFTDRFVDLVGEGFDIAIRTGHLKESSLIAKRLGSGALVLVASPKYLKKSPPLQYPKDLVSHKCIKFVSDEDPGILSVWHLVSNEGIKANFEPEACLCSNSMGAIWHMVAMDEGIALMPKTLVCNDVSREKMVRVLPEWSTAPLPTHLVYPSFTMSSPKIREMIPILEPRLRKIVR